MEPYLTLSVGHVMRIWGWELCPRTKRTCCNTGDEIRSPPTLVWIRSREEEYNLEMIFATNVPAGWATYLGTDISHYSPCGGSVWWIIGFLSAPFILNQEFGTRRAVLLAVQPTNGLSPKLKLDGVWVLRDTWTQVLCSWVHFTRLWT